MESEPTRMCELLVGLPEVNVLGIDDVAGDPLRVHVEVTVDETGLCRLRSVRPREGPTGRSSWSICPCSGRADASGLAQAPVAVSRSRLSDRTRGPRRTCASAAPRMAMTDRAGRWVTEQVGRCARSVNEVAVELGCDWHTVNDTVIAYGERPGRPTPIGSATVEALGLDEVLFVRMRPLAPPGVLHPVGRRGVVASSSTSSPAARALSPWRGWRRRGRRGATRSRFATLDLSGPYRHGLRPS